VSDTTASDSGGPPERVAGTPESRKRDQALVALHRAGDARAFGRLFDAWFDAVYDRIVHRGVAPVDAGAVAVAAFRGAAADLDRGASDPFAVVVLRATRLAVAGRETAPPPPAGAGAEDRLTRATDPRAIAADAGVAAMCWQAAEVLGERVRETLDLHHRHGLTAREIAAVLGDEPGTTEEVLAKLPLGFGNTVRARVLWRGGDPEHDELRAQLGAGAAFDVDTVRTLTRHMKECDPCRARAMVALPPVEVFSAIPLSAAPVGIKKQAVAALAASGIAMSGSTLFEPDMAAAAETPEAGVGAAGVPAAAGAGAALAGAEVAAADPGDSGDASGWASTDEGPTTADEATPAGTGGGSGAEGAGLPVPSTAVARTGSSPTPPSNGGPVHEPVKGGDRPAGHEFVVGNRKRLLVAGGVAAVVLLIGGILLAGRGGEEASTQLATGEEPATTTTLRPTTTTRPVTTTSRETTTTTSTTTPTPADTPTTAVGAGGGSGGAGDGGGTGGGGGASGGGGSGGGSGGGGGGSGGGGGGTTSTTAPLNLQISFGLAPSNPKQGYTSANAPALRWSVSATRPVTITVRGPDPLYSELPEGDVKVCPNGWAGTSCTAPKGTYFYEIVVLDGGQLVGQRTATLTIR
jgi:uncharacterized protein (DUF1810 family)